MSHHEAVARRLRNAYADGPVAPLRDVLQSDDGVGAYAVQHLNVRHWVDSGRRVVGRKVGLTSKAVQAQLGVDQPDYGFLFEDMEIADGGVLAVDKVIQPKVEGEVALVLACDLDGGGISAADITAATDHAVASIEIVDSRIDDWKISFADTVADNGSSAFFVLGKERRNLEGLDLYTCGMVMEINGEIASVGAGAACLGHPLNAAAWLARVMVANGSPLKAGDVVLTGALGQMAPINPGDHVRVKIGGLGEASFTFSRRD